MRADGPVGNRSRQPTKRENNFRPVCGAKVSLARGTKKLLGNRSFPASLTGRLHVWETLGPKTQNSNIKFELNGY